MKIKVVFNDTTPFKCVLEIDFSNVSDNIKSLIQKYTDLENNFEIESQYYSSKKHAKLDAYINLLTILNIDISEYKKIKHQKETMDPLEQLNIFVQKKHAKLQFETPSDYSFPFKAYLELNNGKKFYSEYMFYKDLRYCKKKIALDLLYQLQFEYEDVREVYTKLSKKNTFYFGTIYKFEESTEVEFKGSDTTFKPVSETAMFNKTSTIGENICAFLNTNGGSLFYGIYDNPHIIQGVELKNSYDKVNLRLLNSIRSGMEGITHENYILIKFHEVLIFDTRQENRPPSPPKEIDVYTKYLQEELLRYKKHVDLIPIPTSKIYVIEIVVKKHPTLVLFNSKAYYRNNGQTVTMSLEQLRQRIISEQKI